MDGYYIRPTGSTPSIDFRPVEGILDIRGISTPHDPLSFYGHIFSHLDELNNDDLKEINVSFSLKHITGSTTYIYILIKKLISLVTDTRKVNINWFFEKNSSQMFAAGQEISAHYAHPFKFIEVFKIKYEIRPIE